MILSWKKIRSWKKKKKILSQENNTKLNNAKL